MATNTNSTTARYSCRYCSAESLPSTTPAGEACYECSQCGHVVMAAVASFALTPIATPAQNKAQYLLAQGCQPVAVRGGWLVPSGTRANVIHRVSDSGRCSCEAGTHGRDCWHQAAVKLISMQEAA